MKSILYATDFSKASASALRYANNLSQMLGMRLVITHVYDLPTILGTQLQAPFPDLRKDTGGYERKRLIDFYEGIIGADISRPEEVIFDPVENMSVLSGIISKATDWHARMIIVGMKGENALKDFVMGSTAKKLIDKAPCPVLTVPTNHHFEKLTDLVYATDFEIEDLKALEKVVELAKVWEADIRVVHVTADKQYAGNSQMEWFREMVSNKIDYDRIHFEVLESDNILSSLEKYSKNQHAGMIAMLERIQKGAAKKLFHTGHVKQMASRNQLPLLSFNERNLQALFF
jgi:nucleotide-binding universal stress UspA family protein